MQTHENMYATNTTFGYSDGFMVAAAVTAFDGSSVDIQDPEVGEVKFYLKNWDVDEVNYSLKFTQLKSRICNRDDLNYGNSSDESPFFPISQYNQVELAQYGAGKMRCLDEVENLKLWGDYDTSKASNLMVVFEKCDIKKRPLGQKCKTE